MNNRQINHVLMAFAESRSQWISSLVKNPSNTQAPVYIMTINAKMEVYRGMWNWNDESEEMVSV